MLPDHPVGIKACNRIERKIAHVHIMDASQIQGHLFLRTTRKIEITVNIKTALIIYSPFVRHIVLATTFCHIKTNVRLERKIAPRCVGQTGRDKRIILIGIQMPVCHFPGCCPGK